MPPSPDESGSKTAASSAADSSATSSARIARIPLAALLIYPATLFIGFLYALLSPDVKPGAYTATLEEPVNYFAKKSNLFNQLFVKIGWFWTTIAFVALLLTQRGFSAGKSNAGANRRMAQACVRYALVTLSWVITTQWALGPPLVDRGFTATGGKCVRAPTGNVRVTETTGEHGEPRIESFEVFSAAECKGQGGSWRGGHDISGHTFMLVLMSAFLLLEWYGSSTWEVDVKAGDGIELREKTRPDDKEDDQYKVEQKAKWVRNVIFVMVGLSFWMLLMTAIFFHTWGEKIAGLLIALGSIYAVYWLPRQIPNLRNTVGIPGV